MCNPKEKCKLFKNCHNWNMLGLLLKVFSSGWSHDECTKLYMCVDAIKSVKAKSVENTYFIC